MDKIIVEFTGTIIRQIFMSENYCMYAVDVDKEKYPNIKFSVFGNAVIGGNLTTLVLNSEYYIKAEERSNDKGYRYEVINIRKADLRSEEDVYTFLQEILTFNQASELYRHYPNIVDLVVSGRSDEVDLSKLHGIKGYTFDKIKEKIIENYALFDLIAEFNGVMTISMMKKLYEKYPSIEKIRNEIRKKPYKCLCGLSRVGFKTADALLLDMEKQGIIKFDFDLRSSKERCLACILYFLEENENNGNTKMTMQDLLKQVQKLTPACVNHFVDCIKENESNIYYDKETLDIALRRTYETEKYIADTIKNTLEIDKKWDIDYESYRNSGEFPLTDDQLKALELVCNNQISILCGFAGCVDADTEYFNGNEWVRIADYKEGDRVLQYNEDGTANLIEPLDYIKNPEDTLYHFETKYGLNQTLSLNHVVPYITSKGNLHKKTFKEVMDDQNNKGFHGKFITTFGYSGTGIELSDDEIRLMIAVFADGSFHKYSLNESSSVYGKVRVNLKKERKKERLEFLLNLLNLPYKKMKSTSEGYHWYYFYPPLVEKHFPKEWYNCSKHQLEIIADEVMKWDGCYKKNNCYSTTYKSDADFIQFVFTALGYRAVIKTDDRRGQEYLTSNKLYIRKSVEYEVLYNKRTLVGMCTDNRLDHTKTKIEEYKTVDGYEYCFTVPSHMLVLRRNDRIFITGNSGKTATTNTLIKMLLDNNKSFLLLSPTARAAKVLSGYTKQDAFTIHRGYGYNPESGWGYNKENKVPYDIIIADEMSMCDVFLFKHLLDGIDFNTTKLLIIGDKAQLCSVSAGNLLNDLINSRVVPSIFLNKIFRYSDGGLMQAATDTRNSKIYLPKESNKPIVFGENKDYIFWNCDKEKMIENLKGLYKELLEQCDSPSDIMVLSPQNVGAYGTEAINNVLQKIANKNYGTKNFIKSGETLFYGGDLVMQTKNNYHSQPYKEINGVLEEYGEETLIANGELGVIKNIDKFSVYIDFDGTLIRYKTSDMETIMLGYCISTHRSQGGSAKIVILLSCSSHSFMINSNLNYVGLTRTREKCFHLGNLKTINMAVKKKENLQRKTFLEDLLKNKNN